jgi:hypothetical protein
MTQKARLAPSPSAGAGDGPLGGIELLMALPSGLGNSVGSSVGSAVGDTDALIEQLRREKLLLELRLSDVLVAPSLLPPRQGLPSQT